MNLKNTTRNQTAIDKIRSKFIGYSPEKGNNPRITYDGDWLLGHVEGYKMAGEKLDRCLNEAILPVIDAPDFVMEEKREDLVENVHTLWSLI